MEKRTGIVTMKGTPITLVGHEIKPGDKARDFQCLTKELTPYGLKDMEGKIKIISVVPSIDTGVCNLQTLRFNNEAEKLNNVAIATISMDLPFALSRYCGDKGINNLIVLSDHKDASFGLAYGFLIEELRLLSRGVLVIDQNNVVKYVEYVKEIATEPDYEKALAVARSL